MKPDTKGPIRTTCLWGHPVLGEMGTTCLPPPLTPRDLGCVPIAESNMWVVTRSTGGSENFWNDLSLGP